MSLRAYKIAFLLGAKLEGSFGKNLSKAENKLSSISDNMSRMGTTMTKAVSLPLLAVATNAIRVGTEYEKSLSQIQARTNMASYEIDELGRSFREMAVSGRYGAFGAREIAAAHASVAVYGQSAYHSTELMRSSMVLATATNNDLGASAYFLGNYLLKIGKDASYAERYINVFAAANQRTQIGLLTLQNYLFRANGTLQATNISGTAATAMFSQLYQAGVRGAQVYSGVENALRSLLNPTQAQNEALRRLNIEREYENGQLRDGVSFLMDVANALANMEGSQLAYYSNLLGATAAGAQFLDGILDIRDSLPDTIAALYEAANAAYGTGTAFEMAEMQQNGLAGTAQKLRVRLEEMQLQISDALLPKVMEIVEVVGSLVYRFSTLDEGTQRTIIKFTLLLALLGPTLVVLSKLIKTGIAVKNTVVGVATAIKGFATASKIATAATQAQEMATRASIAADALSEKAKTARAAATKAGKIADNLAMKAEIARATHGAAHAKVIKAQTAAESARKAATTLGTVATTASAKAESMRTAATKAATVAQTAQAKVTTAVTARLKLNTAAQLLSTKASGLVVAATKAKTAAFVLMSKKIMMIPVFGWILAAITAVIAVITVLVRWLNRVGDEYAALSDEAEKLRERQEALTGAAADAAAQFAKKARSMAATQEQLRGVAERMGDLAQRTELSAGELATLENYIEQLNSSVPGLALALGNYANGLNMSAEALERYIDTAERQYAMDRQLEERTRLQIEAIELEHERVEALQRYIELNEKYSKRIYDGTFRRRADQNALRDAINEHAAVLENYSAALEANAIAQSAMTDGINANATALEANRLATDRYRQAQQVAAREVEALTGAIKWQTLYAQEWERAQSDAISKMNSAFESYARITTNVFRSVEQQAAVSVQDMTRNLIDNARMVEGWSKNLQILAQRGLDEGLLEQLRAAGPEAAATVAALVEACDKQLAELNSAFEDSTRVAIESMCRAMDPFEVTASAQELIDHVALAILENKSMEDAMIANVQAAYRAFMIEANRKNFAGIGSLIANSAASGMSWAGVTANMASMHSVPEFAVGSNYTPGTFIAGERGAELITNAQGSKVFTALETNRIFQNLTKGAEIVHSFLSNLIRFEEPGDDGGYRPRPIDYINKLRESVTYNNSGGDFHYRAGDITINGSGLSADETKALLNQYSKEEAARFAAYYREMRAREMRLSNA